MELFEGIADVFKLTLLFFFYFIYLFIYFFQKTPGIFAGPGSNSDPF